MKVIRKLGVFDSGVGGLSVLKELIKLPIPEFIYVADTKNLPYGEKTQEQIIDFSSQVIDYLVQYHNVDAIVIACHTASALALDRIKMQHPELLIIGVVDPVVDVALGTTINKIIGVIGTPATIGHQIHKKKILAQLPSATVISQSCPRFVPLIEDGLHDKGALKKACAEYLTPLKDHGCDTVIIGCTHYELILGEIGKFLGKTVSLVSAPTHTAYILQKELDLASEGSQGILSSKIHYYTTGDTEQFKRNAEYLAHLPLETVTQIRLPYTKYYIPTHSEQQR